VRWVELTKRPLFGGYNYVSEYLFKSKMQGTSSIAVFKSSQLYPNEFCDRAQPIAFGGTNLITIIIMKPIDGLHTIPKPLWTKPNCVPYLDWGFGLTPSHREQTVPILAYAWDRIIQLIYIDDNGTSLEFDGFYHSDKEIINLFFIADSVLFALFESKDGREVKILYTPKFYPGSVRLRPEDDRKSVQ